MVLPVDFPDAGEVQRKIANLDGLIAQLRIVAHQDSLQYFAGLGEAQRGVEIDSLIARRWAQYQADKTETTVKQTTDLQNVVEGKRVSVRVDLGDSRIIKKKREEHSNTLYIYQ